MVTAADATRHWHCNACLKARPELRNAPPCTCQCLLCHCAKYIESAEQRKDRAARVWTKAVNAGMR